MDYQKIINYATTAQAKRGHINELYALIGGNISSSSFFDANVVDTIQKRIDDIEHEIEKIDKKLKKILI